MTGFTNTSEAFNAVLEELQSHMPETTTVLNTTTNVLNATKDVMPDSATVLNATTNVLNATKNAMPDSATVLEAVSEYWMPVAVAVASIATVGLFAKACMGRRHNLQAQQERHEQNELKDEVVPQMLNSSTPGSSSDNEESYNFDKIVAALHDDDKSYASSSDEEADLEYSSSEEDVSRKTKLK